MRAAVSTLESLEFEAVRQMCARRCAGTLGEALARSLVPFESEGDAEAALEETSEAREVLDETGRPPIGLASDPKEAISRLGIADIRLAAVEVLALVRLCAACVAARRALGRSQGRWARLRSIAAALPDLQSLVDLIEPHLGPNGEIADSASPQLRRLRRRAERLGTEVHGVLEKIMKRAESDRFLSDTFITERGGRHVLPVRAGSPAAPRGIVHGVSSSGATVFLEPLETIELNNELVQTREEEAAEIERILREWTERLSARGDDLEAACAGLGRLDLAMARAALARDQRAVVPRLSSSRGLRLSAARHPVLEETLTKAGGSVVPLTLVLEPDELALVVSGPNTGGKSVALKTVGLLALMAHSGMHVPAEEAEFPRLRQVLVDIGDRQSIVESLSTFSAHIANIAAMLSELNPPCLVLLDEIGTGTDPAEGAALATALLEHLMSSGALTIVTTHHGALKTWAYSTPGVANAAVEFDAERLRPTYKLRMGVAGASSGLAIATRLGLDPSIIEAASSRVSPDAREAETLLARLRELLGAAEADREEVGRQRELLERQRREVARSAEEAEASRRGRFDREASAVLEDLRRKTEEMLAGIDDRRVKMRLERERARGATELRREVAGQMQRLGIGVSREPPLGGAGGRMVAGAKVLISSLGREGTIEEADEEQALVRVGGARVRVRLTECRLSAEQGAGARSAAGQPLPSGVTAEIASRANVPGEILLIGLTVDEALSRLDKFLDDAFLSGRSEVRVIHGHGSGRLRQAVRQFLSGHAHVASHRPGSAMEGGTGATIVEMR